MEKLKFEIQLSLYKNENFIPMSTDEEDSARELKNEGLIGFSDSQGYFLTEKGKADFESNLTPQ